MPIKPRRRLWVPHRPIRREAPKTTLQEWPHERHPTENDDISQIVAFLDLDAETPNVGTRNKMRLMIRTLAYLKQWKSGSYDEWVARLSVRLNVSVRTVRDNYLDPLISEGIVKRLGSKLVFKGLPEGDVGDAEEEEA